jgi:hypothetical protein
MNMPLFSGEKLLACSLNIKTPSVHKAAAGYTARKIVWSGFLLEINNKLTTIKQAISDAELKKLKITWPSVKVCSSVTISWKLTAVAPNKKEMNGFALVFLRYTRHWWIVPAK